MKKSLVVITGASSGIGAGIATLFSQTGYPVALLARNLHEMEALKLANSICIATDVSNKESVLTAIEQAESQFGPTHCLINNAGFGKGGEFTEIAHEDNERMVNVYI